MFKALSDREKDLIKEVRGFVEEERERMEVGKDQIKINDKMEGSCFALGAFNNLLYRQLIYTKYGYGGWGELSGDVLEGLCQYIKNIKDYRNKQ